uniref:Uncharacterized protein n=1 Tax=Poecilia mexicana TaxID=48701 RepID=A0A3B3Z3K4_9TELE
TKAVEDVSQHSHTQTETLREKQKILKTLQAALADIEKKTAHAEQQLRSKLREIHLLEGEMEHLERQRVLLQDHCASINRENVKRHMLIQDKEENARSTLEKISMYRNKMKGHRDAVLQAVSQTEAHRELEENRMLVLKLRQEKEQLKEDLQNPNGITLQTAKVQNIHKMILKYLVSIAGGREQLKKEFEIHAKLKRDIEVQRYEAIVKRLRCQLSRAQAVHSDSSTVPWSRVRLLCHSNATIARHFFYRLKKEN